jgi:hypothetical protein
LPAHDGPNMFAIYLYRFYDSALMPFWLKKRNWKQGPASVGGRKSAAALFRLRHWKNKSSNFASLIRYSIAYVPHLIWMYFVVWGIRAKFYAAEMGEGAEEVIDVEEAKA